MRRRVVLFDRNKAVIVLARNRRSFRVKDVCLLPEFEGAKVVNVHKYLIRLRDKDVLKSWKVSGAVFWSLADRYEQHVPAIYRNENCKPFYYVVPIFRHNAEWLVNAGCEWRV